jgi:hypothetical protein
MWKQGWMLSTHLELGDKWGDAWNHYVSILHMSNVHIRHTEDELVWVLLASIFYTPKQGYIHLNYEIS